MPFSPTIRTLESRHNPRLKELRRTIAAPGKNSGGLIGIEGPNLIAEALRASLSLHSLFVAEENLQLLDGLAVRPETEVFAVPRALLAPALDTESPQPVAALAVQPRWSWNGLFESGKRILVLAGLQDPGNLGTLLRSAEAFGASGVVALPGTVSPWNPKSLRASAGSAFRLPFVAATAETAFERLRAAGLRIWTTAVEGATPASEAALDGPFALIVGNEGNGVPPAIAAQADAALTIPCPGPVESLNAAVAASILLYEASRQRAAGNPPAQRKPSPAARKRSAR